MKSKGGKQIVNMIPEKETRDSHSYCYSVYKTKKLFSEQKKLRLKKYNPVKRKHEWFVETKLPRHTK
jgi:large subunit ribosomal protein L33